jgi:hypothetical protein
MLITDHTIIYPDRVLHVSDTGPGRFELISQADALEWAAEHDIAVDCVNPQGSTSIRLYEFAPTTEIQYLTVRLRWH